MQQHAALVEHVVGEQLDLPVIDPRAEAQIERSPRWRVAGDTYAATRDILQLTLLGEVDYRGSRKVVDGRGVIPGHLLGDPIWRQGVQNLVDTIPVQHKSGGRSLLGLKSYDQGRKAFQGTGKHVVWLDEEPPMDVYGECLVRTATLDAPAPSLCENSIAGDFTYQPG